MLHVIALVGIDGAGKTTQAQLVTQWLSSQSIVARYWRNAGGRCWCDRMAQRVGYQDAEALVGRRVMLCVETALRWLAITRALMVSFLCRQVAVMDRYTYCQYASIRTRGGRGERWARLIFGIFPRPTVTFYMDVSPYRACGRIEDRGIDSEEADYLIEMDKSYRSLSEFESFTTVDASGSIEDIGYYVRKIVVATLEPYYVFGNTT